MIDWDAFKRQIQSNPQKMLGYVLGIAACFLVIWILVVMQTDTAGQRVVVDQSGRLDSLRISLNRATGDSLVGTKEQDVVTAQQEKSSSPFANALPTFLILMAAIGGLWYWIKKRNTQPGSVGGQTVFEKIGIQEVTGGQQISVIKINSEYWVLGSGSQGMNLLHRFSEDEWDGPVVSEKESSKTKGKLFSSILSDKKAEGVSGGNGSN